MQCINGKPPFLRKPNVFAGFIKNTVTVGQVTFGKNWTTKQTWILPLSLMQRRVFVRDVDLDLVYINVSLSDLFLNKNMEEQIYYCIYFIGYDSV